MEKEASVIGNEVKELKRQLKEAKQTEKRNLKEEKKERKKQQKLERARFREEERMRKVQMKEEKKLKKELDKPEVHKENISNLRDDRRKEKKEREPDLDLLPVTWVSSYLPIRQIKNGVIYTTDHRYVKLIEILPINFLLRSSSEQRNIIMSFMSYLKIAPVKIQFKVVSKKADISEYIEKIKEEAEREPDYRVRVPAGWLSLLINAGEGIDVDVFFFRQDKSKSMERIGRRIRLNRSKIKDTYDTNTDFDDLSESIHAGYYLKRGLSGSEDFYYMSTLITITGYSAKEVEWRVREMTKLLNSQDIGVISCMFREENAFLSSLPLLCLDKKLYERSKRNVLTSGVASCYPFTSYEMSDKDGIMMGVNKANNSLVIVDIFNTKIYKNANIAILGTSGAGKTFTMQLMALRLRRKNVQVFIIAPDKGHEFARACNNIGGAFIQISPASPNCINVMEIRPTDTSASEILDGYTVERSELAMKIQSLHIFFSLLIPDLSHEEKQLLDEALVITYAEKGITHDNQSLENPDKPGQYKDMPILGDLYEVLLRKRECRRMANILNRLVHGSASTFNQKTNVDLSNKYVVLDISELSGDLLLGMFVALDFVWAKAKEDRTVEKAIFVDEAWKLLVSNELAGEYLLEIFKVIRAYGGSAICATQDLVDFFALKGGKLGRGILNNSKTKIILNMETSEAENIREELDLSEAEAMSITRFERGTGLISTNSNNLIVDFKASQLEKDLITTDRKDLQELKERLQKYGQQAYGKQTT